MRYGAEYVLTYIHNLWRFLRAARRADPAHHGIDTTRQTLVASSPSFVSQEIELLSSLRQGDWQQAACCAVKHETPSKDGERKGRPSRPPARSVALPPPPPPAPSFCRAAATDTADHENELGFIKFFKNLPEKDVSTIRIFERSVPLPPHLLFACRSLTTRSPRIRHSTLCTAKTPCS
jgi:hypothetical protein